MDLEIGSTVGDYQVIDVLGAGGMGKVYKVRNVISDRVEAMKVLLPDLAHASELGDRFLREIKVQASLEHPNIAGLHTALHVGNQLFMLIEFVEGVTIDQKLKQGPLPVAQAVDYTTQVLAALDYAHSRGVVHRDIKPANMMLTPAGVVKLLDFGIAKATSDAKLTMTGATMGSLYYMSPEQIEGGALDGRADLYSVGVSLYQMVTGKRPFDGESQYQIMASHLLTRPVPPIQIDPSLPQALNDVILLSVAKDANERFQTAAAFGNALRSVMPAGTAPAPTLRPMMPAATATMAAMARPAAPVAPPPPAAAPVGAAPAPVAAAVAPSPAPANVPPAQPRPAKSHRGLWMAIGGLAAAAAVVAVVQFGPWKGTKAAVNAPKPIVQQTTVPAATVTPPTVTTPPVSQPAAVPDQGPPEKPAVAVEKPVVEKPHPPLRQTPVSRPAEVQATPAQQQPQSVPVQAQPQAVAPPQQTAPPPVVQPAQPTAEQRRKEMQGAREQYAMLGARARGIMSTLQSLQRAQAAKGLGLNSRLQEPADLMNSFMEGAASALNAGDAESAKDLMDKAERQIEKLEQMLNR